MPQPLSSWLNRLEFVGKDLKLTGREAPTFPGVTKKHTWFMLPEAAMLASIKNERTRALYLANLCRIFVFVEYNIECAFQDLFTRSNAAFLSLPQWRLMLGMSENDLKKGDSRMAGKRKEIEDLLADMIRQTPVS